MKKPTCLRALHLLLLPLLLTSAGLTSCGDDEKNDSTPTLLGRWQAPGIRHTDYDASGQVTGTSMITQVITLDVTTTTLTSSYPGSTTKPEVDAYTQKGDEIILANPGGETTFVRNLTSNSFTFEINGNRVAGKAYYQDNIDFKR